MKYALTAPTCIKGTIDLPASKSISNRALLLSVLAAGKTDVTHVAHCDDTMVMEYALQKRDPVIDIGAAGTAMRFLTAYFATQEGKRILTGSERMKQRPVKILVEALNALGASIHYLEQEGFPPLEINGTALKGGELHLQGNVSSQYISALLMIAPTLKQGLSLTLEGEIVSRPYIHMTLEMMRLFGIESQWTDHRIVVRPQPYRFYPFEVESDWSAASYWYGMAALAPKTLLQLKGLKKDSLQGDAQCASIFESLGVHTSYHPDGITIESTERPVPFFSYHFIDQPDLAQTVIVTCCLLGIPFHCEGLQSLKIKETDRMAALINELAKLGYSLKQHDHGTLSWDGSMKSAVSPAVIETYNDHRMAMSFALTSFRHPVLIADPEVVSKSYPAFWDDLKQTGFSIEIV
ncbi:MAG: 3-phosphoshikimate 1-carboxyvinyltransferase [Microbacter sp.]